MQGESKTGALGPWFVLMAAMLWGTTGTAQAFAPAGFDSTVLGTLRLALGGSLLFLLAFFRGELGLKGWPLKATFLAAFFTASYQVCFFWGVAKTGVAVGTIVGIGSAPVAAGLLDMIFTGQMPGRRWMISTSLAIAGCSLLAASGGSIAVDPFGILLAVGAGASYAAYTLALKKLLVGRKPNAVIAVVFLLGALLLLPLLVGRDFAWLAEPNGLPVILHLGLVTAALAYWLFARGLKGVAASTAVTLSLAEPLTAGLLGVTVLGEQLTPLSMTGIGLLFSALVYLSLGARQLPKEAKIQAVG